MSESDPRPEDPAGDAPTDIEIPDPAAPEPAEASVEVLQSENAELKDRLLRAVAEAENTRRRAEREKSEAAKYGIANFARDLLSVADNMARALDAAPEGGADPALKGLIDGIRMTERDLMSCFERHGIAQISPKGEKFDPNLHQAIAEVPGAGEPTGVVVDVAQPGFKIGDRVLRAAMVTVSNGLGARNSDGGEDAGPGGRVDTSA